MKLTEGKQYENPPAGNFIARCYAVIDMGTQQHSYNGEAWSSRDMRLSFELPTESMTGKFSAEDKGKPFTVHMTVKQSLHAKAKLRPLLEGWRGRKFTKEELAGFEIKQVLGKPCRVTLVENGDYVNISSISPLARNDQAPKQVNPSVFVSLDPQEYDSAAFAVLGEKTKQKIAGSPEYAALTGNASESLPEPQSEVGAPPESEDVPF